MKWKTMTPFIVTDESKPGDMKVIAVTANKTMYTLDWDCEVASERDAANGRLIAAAPDLLEACLGLLDMVTDNRTHGPEIDRACEAIAKSVGEAITHEPKTLQVHV